MFYIPSIGDRTERERERERERNALSGQQGESGFAKRLAWTALVAAGLMLTACGSSDDDGGCGGGGPISLALIDSGFPAFDSYESGLTLSQVKSHKEYEPVSTSKINSFIASLSGFASIGPNTYAKSDVITDVNGSVVIDDADDIDLYLTSKSIIHTDAQFESIYNIISAIGASVADVHRYKTYSSGDTLSSFNSYASTLQSQGMGCYKNGSDNWDCEKCVGGLEYSWETYGNRAVWSID